MVFNMICGATHYDSGYVVGLTDGVAYIPLSFRPKMVIAVRGMDTVNPTGKLAYYTWDGTTESCKYQSANSGGACHWYVGTGTWSNGTLQIQVATESATNIHTAYIAVG